MSGRPDGRAAGQFRKIHMKTGVVSQAAGSAYTENNGTKVMCAVYGPRQMSGSDVEFSARGKLRCDYKEALFATTANRWKRRANIQADKRTQEEKSKAYSLLMMQALEQSIPLENFPKSVIEVYALVLEESGGTLATAITCASLALADAGIELFDLVASCAVAGHEGGIVLDPNREEESEAASSMLVAMMPSLNEVTQLFQQGQIEHDQALEAIELSVDGCAKIHRLMRNCLIEAAQEKFAAQGGSGNACV